jgi:predicted O-linked N-acetylglucosamine transferase (SPINDLY family)
MTERPTPPASEARLASAARHHQQGRLEEAEAGYRAVLASDADHADALANLATLAHATGRSKLALSLLEHGIDKHPDSPVLRLNLGEVYRQLGRFYEAILSLSHAHRAMPDLPQARIALCRAYGARGAQAREAGKLDEALDDFRQAVAIDDDDGSAHYNLGTCLKDAGQLAEAETHLRRAVALAPEDADGHNNLGNTLKAQGHCAEAVEAYRLALRLDPHDAHRGSNLLLALNYEQALSPLAMRREHQAWAEQHGLPMRAPTPREAKGRLRIAYVSGDFRNHSVAHFIEPVLRAHDRRKVTVRCYAEVRRPDEVTARLRGLSDDWCDTTALDDAALIARIEADRIDVLIDLAGHTRHHRLVALSAKPAPVMLTYLGYPNTTGLGCFDGRLVDAISDPEHTTDEGHVETLLRLDGGFLCYQARSDAPAVGPPPCIENGYLTFGSLNAVPKITPQVIALWSRLLAQCDDSRLLLKSPSFEDDGTRARFEALFAAHDIAPERLSLRGFLADEQAHLACYADIDIALDPFPYGGTTTTCEALWMGVPVVTLVGQQHGGRVGASLLTQVGLEAHCAATHDAYLTIALRLASDPEALQTLRTGMRERVATSPLCDAARMAGALEAVYLRLHTKCLQTRETACDA